MTPTERQLADRMTIFVECLLCGKRVGTRFDDFAESLGARVEAEGGYHFECDCGNCTCSQEDSFVTWSELDK
jgi:hypothetical protein